MKSIKKLIFSLIICILVFGSKGLQGQPFTPRQIFTVTNSSEINILPGTIFFADSLILTPLVEIKLTNTSLTRNSAVVNLTGIPYISKVFKFSNTTNPFSGLVQINYADNLLNGIAESNLNMFGFNGSSWQLYPGGTNDMNNNTVISPVFVAVTLNEITLGGCMPPAAPIITTVTQPTCSTATGSVAFSGLPGTPYWFLTETTNGGMINGSGSTGTFTDLAPGTYTFIVTSPDGCMSAASNSVTINSQLQLSQNKKLIVSVFLEGMYDGANINLKTTLNNLSLIPKTQPYNVAPWSYAGSESVASIPAGVVDWVLVELRQAVSPSLALASTILPGWPRAYFLNSNGTIVDLDGTSYPLIGNPSNNPNLYVVIHHRNHIAIMSATELIPAACDNYSYNFTDLVTKAYGNSAGYKQLKTGVCAMVCGDADGDGSISVNDFTKWATDFGKTSLYLSSDIDADGQISVNDFTRWATNFGIGNIAPLKSMNLSGTENGSGNYKSQVPGSR